MFSSKKKMQKNKCSSLPLLKSKSLIYGLTSICISELTLVAQTMFGKWAQSQSGQKWYLEEA